MTQNQIKVHRMAKTFGTMFTISGFKMIKGGYDNLETTTESFNFIKDSFSKIKNIPIAQLDYTYYFTKWENWEEMLTIISMIMKNFKWEAEKFDCDNRARLVSALCSLFFGVNSCGEVYCKVNVANTDKKFLHWMNVVICSNGDSYLFDVDNQCQMMKLVPNQPITMGEWSYDFISARYS